MTSRFSNSMSSNTMKRDNINIDSPLSTQEGTEKNIVAELGTYQLFRPQVLERLSIRRMGPIRLAQPIGASLIFAFSILIGAALVTFVIFGEVTKRARVTGVTVPKAGSLNIATPISGVITRILANEEEMVVQGQPLFEISMERQVENGEVTKLISKQLNVRSETLNAERASRLAQYRQRSETNLARLRNIGSQRIQIEREIALANSQKELAESRLAKFTALKKSGFVSAIQLQQQEGELLAVQSQLAGLSRIREQILADEINVNAEQQGLKDEASIQINQLERASTTIEQEKVENEYRKSVTIVAPRRGMLTTISNEIGQHVNSGQVLASIVATDTVENGIVHVDFYAPSRTAGFVEAGQTVLIRFHAYPYQKFGLYEGRVISVSKTPFAPSNLPTQIGSTILAGTQTQMRTSGEALYRIRVLPKQQSITAYNKSIRFKPGMTADADIVQDRRSIWEWILDPILAVAKRNRLNDI